MSYSHASQYLPSERSGTGNSCIDTIFSWKQNSIPDVLSSDKQSLEASEAQRVSSHNLVRFDISSGIPEGSSLDTAFSFGDFPPTVYYMPEINNHNIQNKLREVNSHFIIISKIIKSQT